MENDNSNKKQNSDKAQSGFMIGVALIIIGCAIFFIGYSQPRIYVNNSENQTQSQYESHSQVENSTNHKEQANNKNSKVQVTYPVNINTASYEELMAVKGIGETKANLIINYRNEVGRFNSIDDLQNIKGFGQATIDKLAPYITV